MMTARAPLALLPLPALLVALGAAPLAAQQRVEVMTATTTATRRLAGDSTERLVRRLTVRVDSLARLYNSEDEGLSAAERQRLAEQIDRTVAELERVRRAYEERLLRGNGATFRVQLEPLRTARTAEGVRTLIQAGAGGPRGWLGIVVNGVAVEPRVEGNELIVHYLTYPEIVSVEPSSPAERAGLLPGDTLIAYDGRDVRDVDISMTRLLKPNARVLVRVGRDGRHRDVPVTIADAPSRIVLRRETLKEAVVGLNGRAVIATAPRFPGSAPVPARAPAALGLSGPVRVMATAPSAAGGMATVTGVAGAQMGSITREWARVMGVSYGVLVMRAPAGSPAAESGLRDGDVIVKAGGQVVRTLPELRVAIEMAVGNGSRTLPIELVRERRTMTTPLRW